MYDNGMVGDRTTITIDTLSGVKTLELTVRDGKMLSARVDMGAAILKPADIPVNMGGDTVIDAPLVVDEKVYHVTCVSMGNPHCVVFTEDDVDDVLCAQTAHPAGETCGRAAQHSDLAVPLCNEVGDRSAGSRPVVHADHRQIGEAQVVGNEGGQHRRNGDVGKSILEVAHAAAQEDDALGLDFPQDLFGGVDNFFL